MKKVSRIILLFILLMFVLFACGPDKRNDIEDKELVEKLTEEKLELKESLDKKDNEIAKLEGLTLKKNDVIKELKESLEMVRFSSYARQDDYKDIFSYLEKSYKIHSDYEIIDEWYVINDDYFEIELLGYEDAIKVDFYTLRLESGEGEILVYSDTDNTDGWRYINDNISEIIDKQEEKNNGGFSYKPYFVIYTQVTLTDGKIIRTSKLPIYNNYIYEDERYTTLFIEILTSDGAQAEDLFFQLSQLFLKEPIHFIEQLSLINKKEKEEISYSLAYEMLMNESEKNNNFKNTLYGIEYKDNCSDFNTTLDNLIHDYENIKREYYE